MNAREGRAGYWRGLRRLAPWLCGFAAAAAVRAADPMAVFDDLVLETAAETRFDVSDDGITIYVSGGVIVRLADLELYADCVVVWCELGGDAQPAGVGEAAGAGVPSPAAGAPPAAAVAAGSPLRSGALGGRYSLLQVYAEGDPVHIVRGLARGEPGALPGDPRSAPAAIYQFSGERVFLDLLAGSGIVVQAVARSLFRAGAGDLPLHLRAAEMRLKPDGVIEANDMQVSTCEFGEPHWHVAPRRVVITDGSAPGTRRIEATGSTVEIGGVPVLYVPWIAGEVGRGGLASRIPLQRLKGGHSSQFGAFVQADWGGDLGEAVDWRLETDAYSRRGVGAGADLMWKMLGGEGFVDTYVIDDQGEDDRFRPRERDLRGRVHALHRQPLGDKLRLDTELSYLSDPSFLEEFFETESKTGKEQESYSYLRYLDGDLRAFALGKVRVNEFDNTTEALPQLGADIAETPLPGGWLYYDSTSEVANLRRKFDNDLGRKPNRSWRGDTTHLLGVPLAAGGLHADVFGGARHTGYEHTPGVSAGEPAGEDGRTSGLAGARAAMSFSRVYDVEVPVLDIHRLRHVITPEVSYLNVFGTDTHPDELFFFDEVDLFDDVQVVRLGLLNRLQTKRPISPGLEQGGVTDGRLQGTPEELLYFDVEALLFPDAERDNDGDVFGGGEIDLTWRIRDGLALVGRAEIGTGSRLETGRAGLGRLVLDELSMAIDWRHDFGPSYDEEPVERTLDFLLAHRHRDDLSRATSLDVEARIDRNWGGSSFLQFDWEDGRFSDAQLQLVRYFHDYAVHFGVEYDSGEDDLGAILSVTAGDLFKSGRRGLDPGGTVPHDMLERSRADRETPPHLDGAREDE